MDEQVRLRDDKKRIALIAHESQLDELLNWASFYRDFLFDYDLYATQTVADCLGEKLRLPVGLIPLDRLDQACQIEAASTGFPIDLIVFFWMTSEAWPKDPAIKTLLEVASRNNIPIAGTRAAADLMFPLPPAPGAVEQGAR
jgi:methylglyoxal synthase